MPFHQDLSVVEEDRMKRKGLDDDDDDDDDDDE
jgi:hypothetical protein